MGSIFRKSRDTLLLITFLCFVGGTLWRVWPAGGRSVGQVAHLTALRAHRQVSRTGGSSDTSNCIHYGLNVWAMRQTHCPKNSLNISPKWEPNIFRTMWLKGVCHEIFHIYFFHDSNPSGPLINRVKYFRIRCRFRRDISSKARKFDSSCGVKILH